MLRAKCHVRSAVALCVALWIATPSARPDDLGRPERVADGVELYRLSDQNLLDPPAPVAIQALRLDTKKARVEIGLAQDRSPARETVPSMAARRGALAAVNAGFFTLADGGPAAILKSGGKVIGGSRRARGAVGIVDDKGRSKLIFDRVTLDPATSTYKPTLGTRAEDWARAADIVSGAGLLFLDKRELTDWKAEVISSEFDVTRHPRTMIGVDDDKRIWLVTVDGRQPVLSAGMNFRELKTLARRLKLRSALNLDGGGSTTMVVKGAVVNHPSDPIGPRPVSDAILVFPRRQP